MNGSTKISGFSPSTSAKSLHSASIARRIDIAHLADRHRQALVRRHARLARRLLHPSLLEFGIAVDVGARRPLPAAAQPGQPVLEIKEKRIALLLAVVADVDAGLGLLGTIARNAARPAATISSAATRFAARAPNEKAGQFLRSRQASGMGGQNSFRAAPHGMALSVSGFATQILGGAGRRAAASVGRQVPRPATSSGRSSDKIRARPRHRP